MTDSLQAQLREAASMGTPLRPRHPQADLLCESADRLDVLERELQEARFDASIARTELDAAVAAERMRVLDALRRGIPVEVHTA